MKTFVRVELYDALLRALHCETNFIQVVTGPRQVGKTTLVLQVADKWDGPTLYKTADSPQTPTASMIVEWWNEARVLAKESNQKVLFIIDEVQKITRWSECVKLLFDEDKRFGTAVRVVLLGSSALLVQRGLTESLAGRFELHRHFHWSFAECVAYAAINLDDYLLFGGYPGALSLRDDFERWARYVRDALIETVLAKDILHMTPVTKPALLRQIFGLATTHPAHIISYQKMLGQLQDVGNTTTIASYLGLLANAFLAVGIERWSGSVVRQRGSIPKLLLFDNACVSAMAGRSRETLRADSAFMGHLVENAVGAKLYAETVLCGGKLYYWRERQEEVDYVVATGAGISAVEVKTGGQTKHSLYSFKSKFPTAHLFVVGESDSALQHGRLPDVTSIALNDFFRNPSCVLPRS